MKNGMCNWFETDDFRWCKKIDDMTYKFCHIVWLDTTTGDEKAKNAKDDADNYCVIAGVVNLWEWEESSVLDILEMYGYNGFEDMNKRFGEASTQIMAECVFEEEYYKDTYVISEEILSKDDAMKFSENWMKGE